MKNKLKKLTLLIACCSMMACSDNNDEEVVVEQPTAVTKEVQNTAANNGIDAPLEFELNDLDGLPVKASDYRGQWLVINYWATWCAPCRDEMPELVKFQTENDYVQILGIAYEDADVTKLKNFAKDFKINYPLLTLDVYNPPAFAEEGGLGLPTTIVYNPEGLRHNKHMGPIDAAGLLAMIKD